MELKNIIFIVVFLGAFGFLAYSLSNKIKMLKTAMFIDRFQNVSDRINNFLIVAFGQSKLLSYKVAGTLHFFFLLQY